MNNNTLGQKIANLRKAKGLTQSALAEKLNVSPQAVSKWETDQAAPDINALYPLAKELGTSIDFLLGEETKPETQYLPAEKRDLDKMILKIRIIDGKDKISVNLPLALLKVMIEIGDDNDISNNISIGGANINLKTEDLEKILMLIDSGTMGKLVEIESADGENIEIYVE